MGPSVKRVLPICSNGSAPLNKMATMPGKTLKNLLQNQESFEADSLYQGLKVYQVCSNDDHKLTFDLFRQDQICVPMHLYGENIYKLFPQNVLMTNG